MAEQLGDLTRTHTCGALRPNDVGSDVVLLGWVHRVRDLGGLLFVDVRDRAGITQVVVDKDDEAVMAKAARWVPEKRPHLRSLVNRRHARWLRELARAEMNAGNMEGIARDLLRQAARLRPMDPKIYGLMVRAAMQRPGVRGEPS